MRAAAANTTLGVTRLEAKKARARDMNTLSLEHSRETFNIGVSAVG